ncbi:MAG TPA: FAD-dependent oxidoreductase [Solirubrobacteraceae bacterium]|jgi:phytoene dehydrogenase-like protein|nr:FAD-dependent oxidoreductase [Solirubrobacteraceae bacterium]
MTASNERCDALVIGAGAGGLTAAALLSHHGYKTLLVESRDRVGGRASSYTTGDGYTVNTGAVAIEYGGALEQAFNAVGAPFEIRVPEPATLFRIKGRDVSLGKGPLGLLVNGALKRGAGILQTDDNETSVKQWLGGYTKNETVHAIFRNLCAAIFAVNSDELPVRAFMTYFLQKGAFRNFGFSPTGTLGLMQGLADTVTEVWLNSEVGDLHVHDNRVTGATIHRAGDTVEVEAEVVVSNIGPQATTELAGREHFDGAYLARLDHELKPTANIVFNIASDVPLLEAPGIITFGITRRLCNMANLTATCPELAPSGKHLYVAYGVPIPAVGEFDEQQEIEATHQDLRDNFDGFDRNAQILSIEVMRGGWPAQRSIAGHDLPRTTSLENLWNVGDGNREYANGGIQACAESGKLAVDEVLKLHGEVPARS